MTKQFNDFSNQIMETVNKSNNILLHCHPYPDPDSIGSVLAMASVLKKMNKDVVLISGDSSLPQYLSSLPNINWIEKKNYTQIDPSKFDLFIILDSSSPSQITQNGEVIFPENMKTIVIDHHATNTGFGNINLVDSTYCSTSQILYDLFELWNVEIDSNIAIALFIGMFADTGGFKYLNTTPEVLEIASKLSKINPDYHKLVFDLENSKKPIEIEMLGLALSSIEKYFSDNVAISAIPYAEVSKRKLSKSDAMEGLVASALRTVVGWNLVASLVEAEPNITTVSIRTRDELRFDVSKIAKSIGEKGGGHRGAAGTIIMEPLESAKNTLLSSFAKEFPELGKV